MKSDHTNLNEVTRRMFVERMAKSAFGLSLLPYFSQQSFAQETTKASDPSKQGSWIEKTQIELQELQEFAPKQLRIRFKTKK